MNMDKLSSLSYLGRLLLSSLGQLYQTYTTTAFSLADSFSQTHPFLRQYLLYIHRCIILSSIPVGVFVIWTVTSCIFSVFLCLLAAVFISLGCIIGSSFFLSISLVLVLIATLLTFLFDKFNASTQATTRIFILIEKIIDSFLSAEHHYNGEAAHSTQSTRLYRQELLDFVPDEDEHPHEYTDYITHGYESISLTPHSESEFRKRNPNSTNYAASTYHSSTPTPTGDNLQDVIDTENSEIDALIRQHSPAESKPNTPLSTSPSTRINFTLPSRPVAVSLEKLETAMKRASDFISRLDEGNAPDLIQQNMLESVDMERIDNQEKHFVGTESTNNGGLVVEK